MLREQEVPVYPISAVTGEGLQPLLEALWQTVSGTSQPILPATPK